MNIKRIWELAIVLCFVFIIMTAVVVVAQDLSLMTGHVCGGAYPYPVCKNYIPVIVNGYPLP